MNETSRNMERHKSEQPHYQQNRSNYSKHLSLLLDSTTLPRRDGHKYRRQDSSAVRAHYRVSLVRGVNFAGTRLAVWRLTSTTSVSIHPARNEQPQSKNDFHPLQFPLHSGPG